MTKEATKISSTLAPMADSCRYTPPSDPCLIVIIGASGDLASRKIIPSLYKLYLNDTLPRTCAILGCARSALDDQGFREKMKAALADTGLDLSRWDGFARRLHYRVIAYDQQSSFDELAAHMHELGEKNTTRGNALFYLSIPPFLFEEVIGFLGKAGLAREPEGGWRRIIVEKPFGWDLESAVRLDRVLNNCFQEHQVYRIDHYLAKETVQNILAFRFANTIFDPLWSRKHIKYVDIRALETVGVENRAGYYEQAGVLRDMFQNHMLQLVSMVAMEPPEKFTTESVRNRKAEVFKALRPIKLDRILSSVVLGQYGPGEIGGSPVPGYRQEQGVAADSKTPTFASMKLFIDNRRWQGVPFYLTSGKRMQEKITTITIQFQDVNKSVFSPDIMASAAPNRLTFSIQPREAISLSMHAKNPGPVMCLRPIDLEFRYENNGSLVSMDAYEKVLLDCLNGEQMLSLRQDSEELCWAFLTPLVEKCEQCISTERILFPYPAGSWGPTEAERINRN